MNWGDPTVHFSVGVPFGLTMVSFPAILKASESSVTVESRVSVIRTLTLREI
jgi:hypothetical protein